MVSLPIGWNGEYTSRYARPKTMFVIRPIAISNGIRIPSPIARADANDGQSDAAAPHHGAWELEAASDESECRDFVLTQSAGFVPSVHETSFYESIRTVLLRVLITEALYEHNPPLPVGPAPTGVDGPNEGY